MEKYTSGATKKGQCNVSVCERLLCTWVPWALTGFEPSVYRNAHTCSLPCALNMKQPMLGGFIKSHTFNWMHMPHQSISRQAIPHPNPLLSTHLKIDQRTLFVSVLDSKENENKTVDVNAISARLLGRWLNSLMHPLMMPSWLLMNMPHQSVSRQAMPHANPLLSIHLQVDQHRLFVSDLGPEMQSKGNENKTVSVYANLCQQDFWRDGWTYVWASWSKSESKFMCCFDTGFMWPPMQDLL